MMRHLLLAAAAMGASLTTATLAAEPVRGVTDTEIVIGSYTDLSGVTAVWGVNNNNAWRLAFDEVNAKGGINGRKIRFITEDNQYQVPRSIQAANKLINLDKVFIMVGNDGTPMNNAVLPMQLEKGMPNMFPLTAARSMYEPYNRLKFGQFASYYDQMRAGVKYFVGQKGKKRLCAMYQDTDFGRDVMNGVWDQTKAMGMKLFAETTHKPTDTDFSAAVAKLREVDCDLVVVGTVVRDTSQIVASIRKIGWDVDIMGPSAIYDSAVADVPGGITEGVYAMTPSLFANPDDPRPAVQGFVKKYNTAFGRDPNFAAEVGWTGAQLTILGLQNAGKDLTVDSFISGMEKIHNYQDIFGSPEFSFSPGQHHGSDKAFLVQIKSSRWVSALPAPLGY